MDDLNNLQIIRQLYKNFSEGNLPGVLSFFDKDVVWIRPGGPDIPFAGTFTGIEGLARMLSVVTNNVKIKSFVPQKFFNNGDTVVAIGYDSADVITTGKTYTSDWIQVFTLKDEKIIHVRVYMDTLLIAKAFQP
jgi:ketosteroid isomerase-like protein